jgi:hypothetical protein
LFPSSTRSTVASRTGTTGSRLIHSNGKAILLLSNPYTTIGKTLSAEATIKGLRKNGGLKLEFWVETPSGKNEQQAKIDIKDLPVGEESRYTAEFTPKETGRYVVYAYLYDGWIRIGYKTEIIYAQKQ